MTGKRVLCVGMCCLDIVMVCKSYPQEDSDQRCLSNQWQRGGNVSNSATIFSEFGVPCEILSVLCTDIGGQFMKKDLELRNIIYENCHFHDSESPCAVIWINSQNGSRTIVSANKNVPEVKFDDFKCLNLQNYSWIHFEARPYFQDIKKMIQFVQDWNSVDGHEAIKTSLEIEKPRLELLELLPLPDIVFISKDFAKACGQSNMETAAEYLCPKLRAGGIIICAWGEKGASAKRADEPVVTSEAHKPAKVINTLGAGDTFIAATIMAFLQGKDLSEVIQIGCKVAGTKCGMHETSGLAQLCQYL